MDIAAINSRGAQGSNAGDDFHELWAARQAIRLLANEDGLEAITLEGVAAKDASAPVDAWDGVDCTLYYGGTGAAEATRVELVQVKYSTANPDSPWSVPRLTGPRRDRSVLRKMAKAWKEMRGRSPHARVEVVLVSNQPVDPEVSKAVQHASGHPTTIPKRQPASGAPPAIRLAYASGLLTPDDFQRFATALRFEGEAGSRLAVEGRLLRAIANWTGPSITQAERDFRQFIRRSMMPEAKDQVTTRTDVRLRLIGASDEHGLFPCPSQIDPIEEPVQRQSVADAIAALTGGAQYISLDGGAGTGKTTALREIEAALPAGSAMVVYDCYGKGRYLDASALRHRPRDAFLQLTNELATRLRLPIFLTPGSQFDHARLFAERLRRGAKALAAQVPGALIVVAVDAADNAIAASKSRSEPHFMRDFLTLRDQPPNVRFIVTSRTGRLPQLQLPPSYNRFQIAPFSLEETAKHVRRHLDVPRHWSEDFHHLTNGIPRVQAYALAAGHGEPQDILGRLMPSGRALDDVFDAQFEEACAKAGGKLIPETLCAGLVALPRPVPVRHLAEVLQEPPDLVADTCTDLAPGLRVADDAVSLADEDLEDFVRRQAEGHLAGVGTRVADRLLSCNDSDAYAAANVADVLLAADREEDLLLLVEAERSPAAVSDPVLRRKVETQRLSAAMKVCRAAGDIPRALRLVLMGAEGIKNEGALRDLVLESPDLACRFAADAVSRLVLADDKSIDQHGPFLFQSLPVHADREDGISYRETLRSLSAWLKARDDETPPGPFKRHRWPIADEDVFGYVEAVLKVEGPGEALQAASTWRPRALHYRIAASLPFRLIAQGYRGWERTVLDGLASDPASYLIVANALALSGDAPSVDQLGRMLKRIDVAAQLQRYRKAGSGQTDGRAYILDAALLTCEVLTAHRAKPNLVADTLAKFLNSKYRRIEALDQSDAFELDLFLRAYALAQARCERSVDPKEALLARTKSSDDQREQRREQEHDEEIKQLVSAILPVYSSVAVALIDRGELGGLEAAQQSVDEGLSRVSRWRTSALRRMAAKQATTLLVAGCEPASAMRAAKALNSSWLDESGVATHQVFARLALHPSLHDTLLSDLSARARETKEMRISGSQKCQALLDIARLMLPLSVDDAKGCFNLAIESSKELDREAIPQIRTFHALVSGGRPSLVEPRTVARQFADVVADAGVRLEGDDYFPWEEAMATLAWLDAPTALACAATWDVEGKAHISQLLPSLLKTGLAAGSIKPALAAGLAVYDDGASEFLIEAVSKASETASPSLPAIAEEAARLAVAYGGQWRELAALMDSQQPAGSWCRSLARQKQFIDDLLEIPTPSPGEPGVQTQSKPDWDAATVVDGALLGHMVDDLVQRARDDGEYIDRAATLESARDAVLPRERVQHLEALAQIVGGLRGLDAARAINAAVRTWAESLAVQEWCRDRLPDVIVDHFDYLARYLPYEPKELAQALGRTGLDGDGRADLLVRGIERHVDDLGPEALFALVGMVAETLAPSDAAELALWYVRRLGARLEHNEGGPLISLPDVPLEVETAAARFLFAYLGDCDHRLRWRAAHAVRSLARLGEVETLRALAKGYNRREEGTFRGVSGFYWLAARLWFVIAMDQIAGETPTVAGEFGDALQEIALDETFPHMLVRSFARDACQKLVASGQLVLDPIVEKQLDAVNESQLPLQSPPERRRGLGGHLWRLTEKTRFRFDPIDTLRYWYEPMLRAFSELSMEDFLAEAERWIIDVWGYEADFSADGATRPLGRFNRRGSDHSSHRHGSIPTLERPDTHVEWHAMWCAAGEFLKTAPLPILPEGDTFTEFNDIDERIRREKLAEPPLWSADLRGSVPLQRENWVAPSERLEDWINYVPEPHLRTQILPIDAPQQLVVAGSSHRGRGEFVETARIASALVAPETGQALLRALQTMGDSWDYGFPEDPPVHVEPIDQGPYRFVGWLRYASRDAGIDANDPFRSDDLGIRCRPGPLVSNACSLHRDVSSQPRWFSRGGDEPMFVYEAWGGPTTHGDDPGFGHTVSGDRLLVRQDDLLAFLQHENWDLIVEVEVTRRGREHRRRLGAEDDDETRGRFARLYRLDGGGGLEIAEGRLGTWTSDRPRA